MRYTLAQVGHLRLQLEGRAGGLQRDLPRPDHASGVQQVRRVSRLGQGAGQAQQHRLRRAQGHGREPGSQAAARHGRSAHLDRGDAGLHLGESQHQHDADAGRCGAAAGRRTARGHPGRRGAQALARLGAARRRGARRGLADRRSRACRQERHRLADLPELPDRPRGQQHAVLQRAALRLRPRQVHLRGRGLSSCSRKARSRRRSGNIVRADRRSLVLRAAAGLLEHGRGAAGHEVARLQRHQAQSLHGAQHRQPAPQPGEVHGHRRAARAQVDSAGSYPQHFITGPKQPESNGARRARWPACAWSTSPRW